MNVSQETDFLFLCVNIFLRFSFSIVSEVKKYKLWKSGLDSSGGEPFSAA